MSRLKSVFVAVMLVLTAVSCCAAESCPPTAQRGEWDAACFSGAGAQRHVKPAHLRKLAFDRSGHALIVIGQPRELLAVDRRGAVVVPGIYHIGDFDFPNARHHLARYSDGAKCGYFDQRNFQVRVAATYDQCQAFGEETAAACNDCEAYCFDSDCHGRTLVGGHGVEIDRRARIVRHFNPAPMAQACGGKPGTLRRQGGAVWLSCPDDPMSPFNMN